MRRLFIAMPLTALLVACGPSSTAPEGTSSASSTLSQPAELSSAAQPLSSGAEGISSAAVVDPLSSAALPSSGAVQSSAAALSSGAKLSSSSGTVALSSSSNALSSSTTVVLSSSSEALSSSTTVVVPSSSSLATVVSSSSATVASSSSWDPFNPTISYGQMTDSRNSKTYKTIIIAGYEVFAQNMDYGELVLGSTSQSDDTKIEKYCYNDDPANCERYGGLYQWSEAHGLPSSCNTSLCQSQIQSQQQGICPDGWHVMTPTELGAISSIFPGYSASALKSSRGGWSSGGTDVRGFSIVAGGRKMSNGSFAEINEGAYFWIAEEAKATTSTLRFIYYTSTTLESLTQNKVQGASIRCTRNI